jgi:hypothetical protein
MGAGSEPKILAGYLQNQSKNITNSLFTNDMNPKWQFIVATAKKSIQMTEIDEIYFYQVVSKHLHSTRYWLINKRNIQR